jgi:hypothetical protein
MRYPLWAFFFLLVMPVFAVHAVVTGRAQLLPMPQTQPQIAVTAEASSGTYWAHAVTVD